MRPRSAAFLVALTRIRYSSKACEEKKAVAKIVKFLKDENTDLQSQLLAAKEDKYFTETKTGRLYPDNIRKCIIQLQGESGVSAKKCPEVIQCVSKWLFGVNFTEKDLPYFKTALNMADEGHMLSKMQVEEAISTQHFDLHMDGTSQDHCKFVGQQFTLESGVIVSWLYACCRRGFTYTSRCSNLLA